MSQLPKVNSSSTQLWETYQESLMGKVPHVIQFCNAEEKSVEKRAALAACIISNANCFKLGMCFGVAYCTLL